MSKALKVLRDIALWIFDIILLIFALASLDDKVVLPFILWLVAILLTNPLILKRLPRLKARVTFPIAIFLSFVGLVVYTVQGNAVEPIEDTPTTLAELPVETAPDLTTVPEETTTEETTTEVTTEDTTEVTTTEKVLDSMDILTADNHPVFNDNITDARSYYGAIAETQSTAFFFDNFSVNLGEVKILDIDGIDTIDNIELYFTEETAVEDATDIAKQYVPSVYTFDSSWETDDDGSTYYVSTYTCDAEDYPEQLYIVVQSTDGVVVQASISTNSYVPRNLQSETEVTTEPVTEKITEKVTEKAKETEVPTKAVDNAPKTYTYVLNTSTGKFHYSSCGDVDKIAPENYATFSGTHDDAVAQGYSPCGHCNP